MDARPALLFYCQHSLGMGHLVRSLALAAGLSAYFRVVFLNGGPLPRGVRLPTGIEIVDLPPLGLDADGRLASRDWRYTVEQAQQLRRERILTVFGSLRPQVVLIELFPFGRKKFKNELLPLLDAAHDLGATRPLILCSLRDILVGRPNQQRHDVRASELANRYFDAILVHADPRFARLEESFHPDALLRIPIHYTGFVLSDAPADAGLAPVLGRQVVVSAGGGLVGEPLLRAAVGAQALLWRAEGVRMKVIAGPFLPASAWQALRVAVRGQAGLQVRRSVPDLTSELRTSAASVSQCGYNTALELVQARVPALVVPYGDGLEDEQMRRARRLERLCMVRVLDPQRLDAPTLAAEIRALLDFRPQAVDLDLAGARNTAQIVSTMACTHNVEEQIEMAQEVS